MKVTVEVLRKLFPYPVSLQKKPFFPGDYGVEKAFLVGVGFGYLNNPKFPTTSEVICALVKINPELSVEAATRYEDKIWVANHTGGDTDRAWQILGRALKFKFLPRKWHTDPRSTLEMKYRIASEVELHLIPCVMAVVDFPPPIVKVVGEILDEGMVIAKCVANSKSLARQFWTMRQLYKGALLFVDSKTIGVQERGKLVDSPFRLDRDERVPEALCNLYVNTFNSATTSCYASDRHMLHRLTAESLLGHVDRCRQRRGKLLAKLLTQTVIESVQRAERF